MSKRTRILALGDVHGRTDILARIIIETMRNPPDLIVQTGDIMADVDCAGTDADEALRLRLQHHSYRNVLEILSMLGRPIFFVFGNHDDPDAECSLAASHNVDRLRARAAHRPPPVVGGWQIVGIGGGPKSQSYFNRYDWDDAWLAQRLPRKIPARLPSILISHTPPLHRALLLKPHERREFASRAITSLLRNNRNIKLSICGHLHRRPTVFTVGRRPVLCCGALCIESNEARSLIEQYFIIELTAQSIDFLHYRRVVKTDAALPVTRTRFKHGRVYRLRQDDSAPR